jgi:hypothetical protein
VRENPFLSVCWADLLCLMNSCIAYISLWHPFDSHLKYHIIFGTNKIKWYFWKYFWLVLIQEYDIQRHPAQCLTDASFGKLTIVEVGCSISKSLGI